MNQPFFERVLHGGDYNPEQWAENVWDEDVRLMREADWNIATLPVFGWVHLQSDEETFRFEWLDRILDKLHAKGIGACLATGTGATPAWPDQKYPDVLRVEENEQRRKHGGCHTSAPIRRIFDGFQATWRGAWPSDTKIIPRLFYGTFTMNTATSVFAICARRSSAIGAKLEQSALWNN